MLLETLLVPTNSYLAFTEAHGMNCTSRPRGPFGHVPPHPQPDCLPCSYADRARTNDARQGATIQHPGWAGEHIGFMPFPVDWM